ISAIAMIAGLATIAISSDQRGTHSGVDADLTVSVGTRTLSLAPGSTIADALHQAGVSPASGDVLDVLGNVLEPDRVAGHVEIYGRTVRMTDVLSDGAQLVIVAGQDRTESLVRRREVIQG